MTPRPHIAEVPMPVQDQRMAEARALFYRAIPLVKITEEPIDTDQRDLGFI